MPDFIEINDLFLRAIVGINPDERVNRQDVMVNIRLEVSTQAAAASDHINDTINYRTICKNVIDLVENSSFHLVEKLTEEVANICLSDKRVSRVWVKLHKPGALRFAKSVGIEIERAQHG